MATLRFVRSVWESFRATSGLEPRLVDNLNVTAALPGIVTFRLPIQAHHTNRLGILHGGTMASLVDLGGSLAVASRGLYSTGVSTDLNITYLSSGGVPGDSLLARVECDRFGKRLAYTRATFWNSKGEIAARGSHTKYVANAWKDERNRIGQLEKEDADLVCLWKEMRGVGEVFPERENCEMLKELCDVSPETQEYVADGGNVG